MNPVPVVVDTIGHLHSQCCAHGIDKGSLVRYLSEAPVISHAEGSIVDQVDPHAPAISDTWHGDGVYQWSSELIAYVQRHDMALPGHVVRHIEERLGR